MNSFTRLLRIVFLLFALLAIMIGILNLLSVKDTLWLFIGVGSVWLSILLQIVEKNFAEESYR